MVNIPCYLLKLSSGNETIGVSRADNFVKIWRNLPISNPNQISLMSMHIVSLAKIPCYLLKLSSGNETMGVSRADNSVKIWRDLPISNPKPDLYNSNAHTKFGENPLMFTQVIIRKRKTDGRTTDGHTDVQRETIIPRHYCVAGYKKGNNSARKPPRKKEKKYGSAYFSCWCYIQNFRILALTIPDRMQVYRADRRTDGEAQTNMLPNLCWQDFPAAIMAKSKN